MKTTVWLLTIFALTGCGTTPAQTYRPRNYDGPPWEIVCKQIKVGLWDFTFVITIDGEQIIKDKFSDFQTSGEYRGEYKDHQITASFNRQRRGVQITVFVDGERAATF